MDLSNENVVHIKKDGVEYLQFRRLLEYSDVINHAYTLGIDKDYRTSTVDKKPLSEDRFQKAMNNYKNICEEIGTNYINCAQPIQLHTKNVKVVDAQINSDKPDLYEMEYNETDGFVTNKSNIILSTTNADCILLMFFDPVKKVISNVHSGWKGTLQEISIEAVKKMINEFGCNPADIICCICPSIRKCHFEVDKDVKDMFYEKFKYLSKINMIIEYNSEKNKWNIDTVLINKVILENIGLKSENIIDSGICSVCNSNIIHSYRVEKQGYGVETALIELK